MSEEEIKALAAELGLDPERLKLFEPWRCLWGRQYRFQYDHGDKLIDYNFVIDPDVVGVDCESIWVRGYVNNGLRELAEKVNGPSN